MKIKNNIERYRFLRKEMVDEEKKQEPEAITAKEALRHATPRRREQYLCGEITEEEFCDYTKDLIISRMRKQLKKDEVALEKAETAPDLQSLSVFVMYGKGKADCDVWCKTTGGPDVVTGKASGHGVDLASSAVADALNKMPCILKELYRYKDAQLKAGKSDYSNTAGTGHTNADIIGYGTGYDVLPRFERGVGLNSFWKVFRTLGFDVKNAGTNLEGETYVLKKIKEDAQ